MRQKTLIALAIVTVPLAAAALFLPGGPGGTGGPARPAGTGPVFPALKDWIGTAAKLTVTGPDGTVTLERKPPADQKPGAVAAEGWTLADKGGYPVEAGTVKPVLAALVALKTVEPKTERPKLYGRLDLADPGKDSQSHAIDLADAGGAHEVKLVVGKHKEDPAGGTGGDAVYIRKPGEARTWLAQPGFQLPSETLGWIDRKIVDVDADKVKDLVLTPAGGKPLELLRDKAGDKLAIKDLPKDAKLKSEDPGAELAAGFRYLDLADVLPAAKLVGPAAGTAHLATFDGLTVDLAMTRSGDGTWVTVTAQGTGDAAKAADEITQRTKGWAYKLEDERATTLTTKLADLLEPPPEKPETAAKAPGAKEPGAKEPAKKPGKP